MIAKKYLLPLRKDFSRIRRESKLIESASFGLLFGELTSADKQLVAGPGIAFIVSKKVDSRAVIRNSVKRKLALAVNNNWAEIPVTARLVFLAKKAAAETASEKLTEEVGTIVGKLVL